MFLFKPVEDTEKRKKEENARDAWQRAADLRVEIIGLSAQASAVQARPVVALGRVLGSEEIFDDFNQGQAQHVAWLAAWIAANPDSVPASQSVTQSSDRTENSPMSSANTLQDSRPEIDAPSDEDDAEIFSLEL